MSQKNINSSLQSPKSMPSSPNFNLQISLSTNTNTMNNKDSKDIGIQERLTRINQEIAIVRKKRMDKGGKDDGRVYTAPTDYTKIPKKKFSHPKLEIIIGEIMYSPYMTNPLNQYPKETYTMSAQLKELKASGVKYDSLSPEEKPFNYSVLKKKFIKEICNYNPGFGVKDKSKDVDISVIPGPYSRNSLIASFSDFTTFSSNPTTSTSQNNTSTTLKHIAEHNNDYTTVNTHNHTNNTNNSSNPIDKKHKLKLQRLRLQPISKDRKTLPSAACSIDTGLKHNSATMLLKKFQQNYQNQYGNYDTTTNDNNGIQISNTNTSTTTVIINTTEDYEYSTKEFENIPEEAIPPTLTTTTIVASIETTVTTATAVIVVVPDEYHDDFASIIDHTTTSNSNTRVDDSDDINAYADDFENDSVNYNNINIDTTTMVNSNININNTTEDFNENNLTATTNTTTSLLNINNNNIDTNTTNTSNNCTLTTEKDIDHKPPRTLIILDDIETSHTSIVLDTNNNINIIANTTTTTTTTNNNIITNNIATNNINHIINTAINDIAHINNLNPVVVTPIHEHLHAHNNTSTTIDTNSTITTTANNNITTTIDNNNTTTTIDIIDTIDISQVPSSPIEIISYTHPMIVNKMNQQIADHTKIDNYITITSSNNINNDLINE